MHPREVNILANIKSAKKRVLVSRAKTERNKAQKTALKTVLKKTETALTQGGENVKETVDLACKRMDQAAAKGIVHKNKAARKKSSLQRRLGSAG